jgi:hypothetical protein
MEESFLLLDNENKKVYEWLKDYTSEGTLDIVMGYFIIGALGYLAKVTNERIKKYRFILGDIVSTEQKKSYTIDLLNENIGIGAIYLNPYWKVDEKDFMRKNTDDSI